MKALLIFTAAVLLAACERTGDRVTISDACNKDDGEIVSVEGFFLLPSVMQADVNPETELTTYELVLADGPNEKSPAISTAVFGTRSSRSNRIAELSPHGFTQRDLQIFTDTGEIAGSLDRLRVTGKLSKHETPAHGQPCVLKVERIEKPDAP
jgi:hypothetical protein